MSWSSSKQIKRSNNHYDINNYTDADATWFQKGWWDTYDWGWIYTNDTSMPVRLTKATFYACAGHSGGKYYCGAKGQGAKLITHGHGCVFTSDIYVIDRSGEHVGEQQGIGSCTVEPIGSFNCSYGGVAGNVCTNDTKTSFGSPQFFSGTRARHPIPITYDTSLSPVVYPGGKLFVTIRPVSWFTASGSVYTGNSALLVMIGDSSNFTSEFQPANTDYIWRLNESGVWKKERKAFLRTNNGWEQMEEI